jgi:hypothetical protein
MPYTASSRIVSFTVTTTPAPPACPEGSECIEVDECIRSGGECIENTYGCGGVTGNCCCRIPPEKKPPPAPPVPPAPPEEVRIPTLAIIIAGVAVAGIVGLAMWRLLRGGH